MPTVNKPNAPYDAHRGNSDGSNTAGGNSGAATSTISPNRHPDQRMDVSSVDRLHRAWRQMVSSFLVAARAHPSPVPNPTQEQIHEQDKIMSDTIETTLRSRSELRLMLSLIEESFTGKDKKRRARLEDDLYSLPTAACSTTFSSSKRRKEEEQNALSSQIDDQQNIDSFDSISLPI